MESNQNPQRKIVFNAPGTQFGVAQPKPLGTTETSTPSVASGVAGRSASEYNTNSVTSDKKDNTVSNPAFRSFAHDIKSNVSDNGVSMAQIVMDEERKRQAAGATTEDIQEAQEKSHVLKTVLVIVGIIAILGGGVALFFTFRSVAPVAIDVNPNELSVIRAQKNTDIELRDAFKNTLIEAVRGVRATNIPEETFVEVRVFEPVGTSSAFVAFPRLMEILEAQIPQELLRSVNDAYALGLYGAPGVNAPFFIFDADTFDNAYVGMKAWERSMVNDIGGMFIPAPALSAIIASSSPSLFQDKVYYNKDTRTVFGSDGKPLFLWAIIDRTRIIVTTDGETLTAVMKRLTLENITR